MPKTYEYEEGKHAQDKFETDMKALFQVPKDATPAKKKAPQKITGLGGQACGSSPGQPECS
jgi:hypothetical protein